MIERREMKREISNPCRGDRDGICYGIGHSTELLMSAERRARLFRNGRNQALRIPREMELAGDEVIIRREGDRLVVEPVAKRGLLALLATLDPIEETFADPDDGLLPLDDIVL